MQVQGQLPAHRLENLEKCLTNPNNDRCVWNHRNLELGGPEMRRDPDEDQDIEKKVSKLRLTQHRMNNGAIGTLDER